MVDQKFYFDDVDYNSQPEFIKHTEPKSGEDDEARNEFLDTHAEYFRKWHMLEPKDTANLSPEQYMVCDNVVYAFVLKAREWGMVSIQVFIRQH